MSSSPQLTAALNDRYVIERELGSGGMAVVYIARDRKHDREVALKVLRPELGAVLGAERFLTEIKIAARLDHPHILTLIDSGDAGGMLYYVLPYVRGETLRDKLNREQQLSLDEALDITKQVASALDYAHRQGLVHRDIKPENILLHEGEAMLTDFGIALAVKEAGGNRLTQTGLSLGTPQYMSPEQATGDRGVDARADVYSLASVLYEMLAGEPPVTGATAQAMIAKLMTEKPTRVRVLRDSVPQPIDDAIAKALAKTPADRFSTAEEFSRALTQGRAATASPAKPATGRRVPLIAAAATVVVLAGAAWALRGTLGAERVHATLGTRTQLTVTGNILTPAISPDGKQLAFSQRTCKASGCTYAVQLQDVGGTSTRSILDGATAVYGLGWSPDRRNLLFNGTVSGRYGSYLLSALGGPPRYLAPGAVSFFADGDSLLIGPSTTNDSVYQVGVAGLDGVPRDSIRVAGAGQSLAGLSAIPGTQYFLTLIIQAPHGLWQVIDRKGRVVDKVVNACTCGGIGSVDAVWLDREGDAAGESIVRLAIDRATGKLSTKQDTMITGLFTGVSITADGSRMVMDQGTIEYGVWAADLPMVLQGKLPGDQRIARASNSVIGWVSPDGNRILLRRVVPTTGEHTEVRFSVRPWSGSAETPVAITGQPRGVRWFDSVTVSVAASIGGTVRLSLVDVRTGAARSEFTVPDSTISGAVPVADGWAWIPASGDRVVIEQGGKRREIAQPRWFQRIYSLVADQRTNRAFIAGWNAGTSDTIGVAAIDIASGSVTQWSAMFAEDGAIDVLADGSVFFEMHRTADMLDLYKLTGPGQQTLIGRPPKPLAGMSVSGDLKRVVAFDRQYSADAWIYQVVRH